MHCDITAGAVQLFGGRKVLEAGKSRLFGYQIAMVRALYRALWICPTGSFRNCDFRLTPTGRSGRPGPAQRRNVMPSPVISGVTNGSSFHRAPAIGGGGCELGGWLTARHAR